MWRRRLSLRKEQARSARRSLAAVALRPGRWQGISTTYQPEQKLLACAALCTTIGVCVTCIMPKEKVKIDGSHLPSTYGDSRAGLIYAVSTQNIFNRTLSHKCELDLEPMLAQPVNWVFVGCF